MEKIIQNKKLILASASPRRQQLLAGLDLKFDILIPEVEEIYPESLKAEDVPVFLSELKSEAFKNQFGIEKNTIVITADTVVILNDKIIGKPKNSQDAIQILQRLSGNKHTVITGVCLRDEKKLISFSALSEVYFKNLSKEEIEYYVQNYQPLDKAGAYGIQEWIGYIGIEKIEGSFYNVMGLPTRKLWEEMNKM